eukprot:5912078-Amphidinium_carterae.1
MVDVDRALRKERHAAAKAGPPCMLCHPEVECGKVHRVVVDCGCEAVGSSGMVVRHILQQRRGSDQWK